jgi:hypothetical protein
MSGNGLMNDAWLVQTVKPSGTGQAGRILPGAWTRTDFFWGATLQKG